MAFFKALGKLVTDSGGPASLTDTEVLAPGSLNGFLSGKNFNRCKRQHELLSLAMEILHFRSFVETYEGKGDLEALFRDRSLPNGQEDIINEPVFIDATHAYERYSENTRNGTHGLTAGYKKIMIFLKKSKKSIFLI